MDPCTQKSTSPLSVKVRVHNKLIFLIDSSVIFKIFPFVFSFEKSVLNWIFVKYWLLKVDNDDDKDYVCTAWTGLRLEPSPWVLLTPIKKFLLEICKAYSYHGNYEHHPYIKLTRTNTWIWYEIHYAMYMIQRPSTQIVSLTKKNYYLTRPLLSKKFRQKFDLFFFYFV